MNLENGGSDARLLEEDGVERIRLEVERLEENGGRRNGWRHGGRRREGLDTEVRRLEKAWV